ncbi:MAG: hypothetical protein IT548_17785 [Alphaproteobacteria bacterium]|nr:hypothetical protein [Alphaproteobacteria bacterium]
MKDVSAMHIPPHEGGTASPFSDEFSESGRRYGLRAPSKRPYVVAGIVSAFWLGATIAFTLGYLGIEGLIALDWPWLAGLFFAAAFPISLVWFSANLARRSLGLQFASEDLLQIAARLIEPEAASGREITRVGRAVRREIDALNAGLEAALVRVRTLESSIGDRLRSVEETARSLEDRGEAIRASLREERETLAAFAATLAADADRVGEMVRSRGAVLKQIAGEAANDLVMAQQTLDTRTAALSSTLDALAAKAHANAQTADRGAASLLAAAEALDGRLDSFLQRGERQRGALNEAVAAMKAETQALEQSLGRNLDALSGIGQQISDQTRRTEAIASDLSRRGEAAAGGLGARADAIAAAFAAQVERIDGTAAAAEDRLKATTAAAAEAAERVRTTFEMAARGATAASEQTGEMTANAMAAMTSALDALTAKTKEARETAAQALSDLKAEAENLPALISSKLAETNLAALALPAPPAAEPSTDEPATAPGGGSAAPDDKATPQAGRPEWFGFARRLAGLVKREPDARGGAGGDWRLSTALANVDDSTIGASAPKPKLTTSVSVDLHREALHVVEKLQALAIDLDRALGDDPAPDLWRRYLAGERSVFTRRLINAIGREGADKIAHRYAADAEFRVHADRYMGEFEGLLDDASARDRDQILVETFLTSQTGRLYLLLAAATGRL